jgi:signal transduction histidine kinase
VSDARASISKPKWAFWRGGSLSRRVMLVAAMWIIPLLVGGGFAFDRAVTSTLTSNFDNGLKQYLDSMIGAAELGPDGEMRFTRALGDQRFFELYSGLYWQVNVPGQKPFQSRSLWDRTLPLNMKIKMPEERRDTVPIWSGEQVRIIQQDIKLANTKTPIRFAIAADIWQLQKQINQFRRTQIRSLLLLGLGLILLSTLQATYGLRPLRAVRKGLEDIRTGTTKRLQSEFPPEIQPLADEMNALLDHTDIAAEQARAHAGNLAHALKTPMAILLNDARDNAPHLAETVTLQMEHMQRHVDHHLARARALAQRAMIAARTPVWPSVQSLSRAMAQIYRDKDIHIETVGDQTLEFRGEKQDLEEIIGNVLDNACKYGGNDVRITVASAPPLKGEKMLRIIVEDNGTGIPVDARERLFQRGVRLDSAQSGTGLGLAIVRDVTELFGGSVALGASEEFGGCEVSICLPAAA